MYVIHAHLLKGAYWLIIRTCDIAHIGHLSEATGSSQWDRRIMNSRSGDNNNSMLS